VPDLPAGGGADGIGAVADLLARQEAGDGLGALVVEAIAVVAVTAGDGQERSGGQDMRPRDLPADGERERGSSAPASA
jgi:hypothetical protein